MMIHSANNLNQSVLSETNAAFRASTFQKQKKQFQDSVRLSGTTHKKSSEDKTYTRKERMHAVWNAIKKDVKTPKHAIIMLSGFIGLVTIPSVIIASLIFPVAVPLLYPIAAGSSVWSGVALWRGLGIAKAAYQNPTIL